MLRYFPLGRNILASSDLTFECIVNIYDLRIVFEDKMENDSIENITPLSDLLLPSKEKQQVVTTGTEDEKTWLKTWCFWTENLELLGILIDRSRKNEYIPTR